MSTSVRPSAAATLSPRPQRRAGTPALAVGLVVLAVALLAACLLSVRYGSRPLTMSDVLGALGNTDPTDTDQLVVRTLRIPRTIAGVMVGVALGLSGAVMQGVARNPLADPGLLGVNAGAALFVVIGISVFGVSAASGYVWFAFVGAAVVAVGVYAIGSIGREGATPVKLALAGAAVSAALVSVTTAVLLTDVETFDRFRFWTVGSLAAAKPAQLWDIAPFVAVGVVLALVTGRLLNALSLGDDVARALGQRIATARIVSALAVVLLCGAATAVAGPIGFLGLTVPHLARIITGPDYRWILPYSALLAPILLLVSDVIGRVVARPGELQVGIVMAIVGAPFFIALVRRRKLAEL
ncbi:FecCD family ABC transporter permease [Solicola sp. PLA-1-18]|uniref:FecCD family ABC transporter permease n=1 Tax=Solicola sp. PLA-1-18 TaxID=3380532 RepID=UPI003B7B62D1